VISGQSHVPVVHKTILNYFNLNTVIFTENELIKSKPTKHYLFGYGSLISNKSASKTGTLGSQRIPVNVHNLERGWVYNVGLHPNITQKETYTAVGTRITKNADKCVNGVITEVSESELLKFDKRELLYQRSVLNYNDIEFLDDNNKLNHDDNKIIVYCYTMNDALSLCWKYFDKNRVLKQSYIDTCLLGCIELGGIQFAIQFIKTTLNWHGYYINDRPTIDNNMTTNNNIYTMIDDLLHEFVPQMKYYPINNAILCV